MYQRQEDRESKEEKKLGGGTETITTYTYSKSWREGMIDSTRFEQPEGHQNPTTKSFKPRELSADTVMLGAFRLPFRLVDRIDSYEPLPAPEPSAAGSLPAPVQRHGDGFYVGENPSSPRVGDLRISFRVVWPTDVSIVARQVGDPLGPYQTSGGGNIAAAGTGIIAFLLAAVMSLVTIAVAWLGYRPLLGGTLLAIVLVCLVVAVRRLRAPAGAAA